MARTDTLANYITDLTNAVREKTGETGLIKASELDTKIGSIQTGGSGSGVYEKDVNFYDYEGTLLYSYTLSEVQNLAELPELPKHSGLVCQGWNWTLEDIISENAPVTVGALYVTDDGKTRLYIHYDTVGYTVKMHFLQTIENGVEVDWGDSSEIQTFPGSGTGEENVIATEHVYDEVGDYIITLNPINDCVLSLGGTISHLNSATIYPLLGPSNAYNDDIVYQQLIRKIELGANVRFAKYPFIVSKFVETITMTKDVTIHGTHDYSPFAAMNSLRAIIIPTTFTSTYYGGFNGTNCSVISLPKSITELDYSSFSSITRLSTVNVPSSVTVSSTQIFQKSNIEKITIPNGITSLSQYSFSECSKLKSVSLPDSMTYIGNYVFKSCPLLDIDKLPANLKSLGTDVFNGCTSLHSLKELPEGLKNIPSYTFSSCKNLNVSLPTNLTSISDYAFYGCAKLELTKLPETLTSIGNRAFYGCTNLALTELPETITSIGSSVFQSCVSLTTMTIHGDITLVDSTAFYGCTNLEEVIFEGNVEKINSNVFYGTQKLTKLVFKGNVDTIPTLNNSNSFTSSSIANGTGYIYIADDLVDTLKSATNWSTYASQIKGLSELS